MDLISPEVLGVQVFKVTVAHTYVVMGVVD